MINDFVLPAVFVGNDNLPNLPDLHIHEKGCRSFSRGIRRFFADTGCVCVLFFLPLVFCLSPFSSSLCFLSFISISSFPAFVQFSFHTLLLPLCPSFSFPPYLSSLVAFSVHLTSGAPPDLFQCFLPFYLIFCVILSLRSSRRCNTRVIEVHNPLEAFDVVVGERVEGLCTIGWKF